MERETSGGDAEHRLARLPSGRHGLPREFVEANHRDRLMAACIEVVAEKGYVETTVADVIKAAAVSRRTFYEFFEDKEACFLATYDVAFAYVSQAVLEAYASGGDWPHRVRSGLAVLLQFLADQPKLAKFAMVEPMAAGPPISDHHREGVASFSVLLTEGEAEPGGLTPPAGTAEALVAGTASLIIQTIGEGRTTELETLLPDVLESLLAPYLGLAEAKRIARE